MESPKTPPKPSDCGSRKLAEHLTSAHKFKDQMIEKIFDNEVYQGYFTEEIFGMDIDIAVLIYLDPSMLILGPMMDFGLPHPNDKRDEENRKMERQINRSKAMERFLMIASGVEVECILAMTNPNLFVKWTLHNIENERNIPSMIPSRKMMEKAATLAKMMVEKEAWKQQLIILENFSNGKDQHSRDCANNSYLEIGNKFISILHKYEPDSESKKEESNKLICYDREFLLKCAQSPLCSKAPPNWTQVALKYPGLAKARKRTSKLISILYKYESVSDSKKEKSDKPICYDREFLLECAQSQLCSKLPPNWAEIVLKYPGMIKGKGDFNLKKDHAKIRSKNLDVLTREDVQVSSQVAGLQRLISLCAECQTDPPCYTIEKGVIGFIKWFDFKNNVGFVTTENDESDIFLPKSGIKIPKSYWTYIIFPNQKCLFDMGNCKSGRIAYNLTAIFS